MACQVSILGLGQRKLQAGQWRTFPLQATKLEEAIRSRRNEMPLQLSEAEWELLRQVRQRKWVGGDEDYQTLIHSRLVFEYRDQGESWFDVNPILLDSLFL